MLHLCRGSSIYTVSQPLLELFGRITELRVTEHVVRQDVSVSVAFIPSDRRRVLPSCDRDCVRIVVVGRRRLDDETLTLQVLYDFRPVRFH